MTSIVLCALLLSGPPQSLETKPAVAPLTGQQLTRLQEFVQTSRQTDLDLRRQLEVKQRELAAHYAQFDLSEETVLRLQAEILDLQQRILVNYHRLQVELRQSVGRERFRFLKARIDRMLNKQRSETAKDSGPDGPE